MLFLNSPFHSHCFSLFYQFTLFWNILISFHSARISTVQSRFFSFTLFRTPLPFHSDIVRQQYINLWVQQQWLNISQLCIERSICSVTCKLWWVQQISVADIQQSDVFALKVSDSRGLIQPFSHAEIAACDRQCTDYAKKSLPVFILRTRAAQICAGSKTKNKNTSFVAVATKLMLKVSDKLGSVWCSYVRKKQSNHNKYVIKITKI